MDAVEETERLTRAAAPRCGPTVLVCVDGRSGSGKTELAVRLGSALGAPVLSLDELLLGWDGLADVVTRARSEVLLPLSRGEAARFRRWDWERDQLDDWQEVSSSPVLVLEGCGAGSHLLGPLTSVLVWLEVPAEVRRRRALARDPAYLPFWDRWATQEDRLYAAERPWDRADLVLEDG